MTPGPDAPPGSLVVLTGATGFIGSHVAEELQRSAAARSRWLVRRRSAVPDDVEVHLGDLEDEGSLAGLTRSADVLIHCASYVGPSPDAAARTNVAGTLALLRAAERSGVRHVLYVSTAGVYGSGPFRDLGAGDLPRAPGSPLSGTRAQAEEAVLACGGTVLRPHLVYGTGDRWVGPRAARLSRLLGGRIEGFDALVSMIDVRRLAAAVVGAALRTSGGGRVYDCNHPVPVPAAECLREFSGLAGIRPAAGRWSETEAAATLREHGEPLHDLQLLATDHWFDSRAVWSDLQLDPGPEFRGAITEHAAWYRTTLQPAAR